MTKLNELQEEVSAWTARNFPDDNRNTVLLGLAEEVGELCRARLKQSQGLRGTWEEWEGEIQKEIVDVLVKLIHVAVVFDISIDDVLTARWATLKERDWVEDKKGHGLPEKEEDSFSAKWPLSHQELIDRMSALADDFAIDDTHQVGSREVSEHIRAVIDGKLDVRQKPLFDFDGSVT